MKRKEAKRQSALKKELLAVEKQERRLALAAQRAVTPVWKRELEARIPEKVSKGLQSAFCKGFALVFDRGRSIIEKGFDKEELQKDHAVLDFAVRLKGGRKELRQLHRNAGRSNLRNLAVTAAEGIGLGALGIGMPDVVLFLGILLRGVYETALGYGFEYGSDRERLFILTMLEASLSSGSARTELDRRVDEMMGPAGEAVSGQQLRDQMEAAASAFAMDMLLLKFLQGVPVIGILGGASDPVYYGRIMRYVRLKYRKRYLLGKTEK